MDRARTENANCFAALQWLLVKARTGDALAVEQGMRLCGWLGWYWHIAGLHLVAEESVRTLLSLSGSDDAEPTLGRALAIAASAEVMSRKAGVVVEHPMAPGVAEQIEALKATVSREETEALTASGGALTTAQVLAMTESG